MIIMKQELKDYPPIDLKALEEKNPGISDNEKNSIILYNKALENLSSDSEDIAIIELKKAVSINPNFHEAMNLLGICYSYIREYSKAVEVFEKVVAAERNSVNALRYLSQMNSGDIPVAVSDAKRKKTMPQSGTSGDSSENRKVTAWFYDVLHIKKNGKINFLEYILGFLIGAVIIFIALSFFYGRQSDADVLLALGHGGGIVDDIENGYEEKYKTLNLDFEVLKKQLEKANADIDYYRNVTKLIEIEKLVSAKKYEDAADRLVLLKTVSFQSVEKDKFDSLFKNTMPKAAWAVFDEGIYLVRMKKYQEALNKLVKVQVYGDSWEYMDNALYNTGLCYKALNDSRNAIAAFQKLKEKYPKSRYIKYADLRIKELTELP